MTIRTLIVDDSTSMRALIRRSLAADVGIEVVGGAGSAQEARALIKALNPDVVTLDIEMPGMNGLDFLDRLMRLRPTPVVMLSSLTSAGAAASLAALESGAFDCFDKRRLQGNEGSASGLTRLVRAAARSRPRALIERRNSPSTVAGGSLYTPRPGSIIAIGASTGGVEALIELLTSFPVNCPPTVVTQHMPASFTPSFAARLDRLCAPKVEEARAGSVLTNGRIYLAPGGDRHLEIGGEETRRHCRLIGDVKVNGHRPSVDRLFHSVACHAGADAVAAILTGMGNDGAQGMKEMRSAGAFTIGQDKATSVVYGMPAAAYQIGAVAEQLPLRRIAARLLTECRA